MVVNHTEKTSFYSGWDIDKLIENGQTSVSLTGFDDTKQIVDLTQYGFTRAPKVLSLINYGDGFWYLSGGRFPTTVLLQITATQIYVRCVASATNVTVKYWVFSSGITS